MLTHGLLRVHCDDCGKDDVVAFSCKGRGFCPSCGTARMVDTAAWLVDAVIPKVPVRQWVLSLPYRVRTLCAYDASACRLVCNVMIRAVSGFYERTARHAGLRQAAAVGAMAAAAVLSVEAFPFAQRFRGEFDRRADGDRRARLQLALRLFGGLLDGQRPTGAHRGRVDRLGAPVDRQSPHLAGQREQVGIGQPTPRPS